VSVMLSPANARVPVSISNSTALPIAKQIAEART
jgi:hypothetical protein